MNYLLYVPFEQALPWSGRWDDLPAAHGAAISFDLLVLGGLLLLGRRLRPARDGVALGVALAYAWAAYPYTAFVLESNSNDSLVALGCVGALLAASLARDYAAGLWTGVALGLASAAKFVTLALAPLFARRAPLVFAAPRCSWRSWPRWRRSCRTAACASSTTARSATRRAAPRRSASGARWTRSTGSRPW